MSDEIRAVLDRISVVTSRGKSKWDYIATFTNQIDTNLTTFDQLINQVNLILKLDPKFKTGGF